MAYTLEYDGTTQTLAEWGADNSGVLSLQNQSAGVLTLNFPGMMTEDVPFAYKGKIILRLGGTVIFRGHALDPQRTAEGNVTGVSIEFVDAWFFLQTGTITQTIYDQSQSAETRTGTLTSGSAVVALTSTTGLRVGLTVVGADIPAETTILSIGTGTMTLSANATASGDEELRFVAGTASNVYALFARLRLGSGFARTSVSDTLSAVIAACDAHHGGGVIQFGACHGDAFSLLPQPVDIQGTFATAVNAALAFAPDAISVMNYEDDPPSVSFYQRAAAPVKTLPYGDGRVQVSQQIKPLHHLQVNGVRLLYQYYLVDGQPATATDAAGESSGPGVIQVSFEMHPPSQAPTSVPAVVESQYLRTVATLKDDPNWWFKNADLEVASADDITSVGVGTVIELDPDAPENDGIEDLSDVAGCTKRIVEGNIPAWLDRDAHLRYVRVRGFLTLTIYNDPDDTSKGSKEVKRRIALTFAATDLGTNEYTNEIVSAHTEGGTFDPESPPSGIAAAILAAQSMLQYQGQVTLTDDDCDFSLATGQVLNLSGSREEWTAMKAQIQGVMHTLQTGTTTVTFGPATHLAPQDYLQIVRRLGMLRPSLGLSSRADGNVTASGSGTVHHPQVQIRLGIKQTDNVQTQKDVDSAGSIERTTANGYMKLSDGTYTITLDSKNHVISLAGDGKSITLDLADLPASGAAKFQAVTFCTAAGNKTAYVLMTTPA